jgi:CubicO group peptidase (beta-lactamase class C family)
MSTKKPGSSNPAAIWKIIFIMAIVTCVTGLPRRAASAGSPPQYQAVETQINSVFDGVTSDDEPGLAVIVRRNGKLVFEKGYGVRDLRTRAKIDGQTNFRLASVTKQFTAMCIMMLVRDHKLEYADTLTDVFPGFPSYGKSISIRNLLNHTSGLLDYEELWEKEFPGRAPEAIPQIKDAGVLDLMKQQTATRFPPGTKWEYSNTGYALLAMAVEQKSGMAFGNFLRERIFDPLKMTNTIAYEKGKNEVKNRAYGHSKDGDKWRETDQSDTSAVLGDGGIYTSVEDMAKWDDELEHHKLLSAKNMRAATDPVVMRAGDRESFPLNDTRHPILYGFGWFLDSYKGHERMYHDGETIGFRTTIQRFTSDRVSVVVLCNRQDLEPQALAEKVEDILIALPN